MGNGLTGHLLRHGRKYFSHSSLAFTPERGWKDLQSCLKSQIVYVLGESRQSRFVFSHFQLLGQRDELGAGHLVGMLAQRVALHSCSIPATALLRKPKENLLNLQLQDNSFSASINSRTSQDQVSYNFKLTDIYFHLRIWPLMLLKQELLWRKEPALGSLFPVICAGEVGGSVKGSGVCKSWGCEVQSKEIWQIKAPVCWGLLYLEHILERFS